VCVERKPVCAHSLIGALITSLVACHARDEDESEKEDEESVCCWLAYSTLTCIYTCCVHARVKDELGRVG